MMSVTEMLPVLRELNRTEKLRVMQFLVSELANEETLIQPGGDYPVWSPYEAFGAANAMQVALKEDEQSAER